MPRFYRNEQRQYSRYTTVNSKAACYFMLIIIIGIYNLI